MKKTTSFYAVLLCIAAITIIHACKKEEEPPQTCKTCTARSKISEVIIKTQQVCSDTEEQSFKNQYNPAEVAVTCR
jgi:hypothetical protein